LNYQKSIKVIQVAQGGARPGAGRKPGVATKRTREIAEAATLKGTTPLEVMLAAMEAAREAGNAREAAFYANMAAPYMHARLSSVNATQQIQGSMQLKIVSEFDDLVDQ
jgi:hypothetical protein